MMIKINKKKSVDSNNQKDNIDSIILEINDQQKSVVVSNIEDFEDIDTDLELNMIQSVEQIEKN